MKSTGSDDAIGGGKIRMLEEDNISVSVTLLGEVECFCLCVLTVSIYLLVLDVLHWRDGISKHEYLLNYL